MIMAAAAAGGATGGLIAAGTFDFTWKEKKKQPRCPKCGAKITKIYENPDDPQEQIYVCEKGHHNHYVNFEAE